MTEYVDCDLCNDPLDYNAEHLTYCGMPLCTPCLEQAVIDDGQEARECDACGELWYTEHLRPVVKQDLAGWTGDLKPYYTDRTYYHCASCRQANVHDEIRAAAAEARRLEEAEFQAKVDHAIEVAKRSQEALRTLR